MFDDLIKTIKAQLYDRIASPLFSSYLISWVGWNYKFLLTLFSGMKVKEKLDFISSVVYPSFHYLLLHGAIYPLITAMLIIFAYPYPAKFTYEFYRRRQVELKEIQQRIDDETPLTREEAKKIRTDALIMTIEFEKEIEKLREENIQLRRLIKESSSNGPGENDLSSIPNLTGSGSASGSESIGTAGDSIGRQISHAMDSAVRHPIADRNLVNFSEPYEYAPLFKNDEKNRNSRLLITGPELIKVSIEELINTSPVFEGHSFMVDLYEENIIITLLSKKGPSKTFKYDYHVPSDGKVGYETLRIKTAFERDFIQFLKDINKHDGKE